jgi:filamentous hemagglutinin family protein
VRDGSLGQTAGSLSGPNFTIGVQNAGQQIQGNNLFHSFSDFNVQTGQTATFTGPNNIANIINRVTGQNLSTIDGLISSRTAMPNANFFLINPNGMVLGPHASFNVGGSVNLSTADYLRMTDGANFFASLTKQSTLSSAPVTAFGFLGAAPPKPITVKSDAEVSNKVNLLVDLDEQGKPLPASAHPFSLVGGDISIASREVITHGGRIDVVSVASEGEVILGVGPFAQAHLGGVRRLGRIDMREGAVLSSGFRVPDSSNTSVAGAVVIRGGQLTMDKAHIRAEAASRESGQTISGDIDIWSEQVNLSNESSMSTLTRPENIRNGGIKSGDIRISAARFAASNSSVITGTSGHTNGISGNISIQGLDGSGSTAGAIILTKASVSSFNFQGAGRDVGGRITFNAHDIQMADSGVAVRLLEGGIGGGVDVTATNRLDITNTGISTQVFEPLGSGIPPAISLQAGTQLNLINARLTGDAPKGQGGAISLTAPLLNIQRGSIKSEVGSAIVNGQTVGVGIGGAIVLAGNVVTLVGTDVSSSHVADVPSSLARDNRAGQITIRGQSETRALAESISIEHGRITTEAKVAEGGLIEFYGKNILLGESVVSASTSGLKNAGDINLTSGDGISLSSSTIATSASQASGGNITLTAPSLVRLVGTNVTSSVFGPAGTQGGNITIDTAHPEFVIMQRSSQVLARAFEGRGGNIDILAGVVLQEPGSAIDASSALGISGSVNIQAPIQQLAGAIAPLPQAFAVPTNLYGQRCAAQKGGQFSSFVHGSRDGLPPQPGDLIPSPLALNSELFIPSTGSQPTQNLATVQTGVAESNHSNISFATSFCMSVVDGSEYLLDRCEAQGGNECAM